MIWCDLSRMALLTVMAAAPAASARLFAALLVVVVLIGRPFVAAENALLPDILSGEATRLVRVCGRQRFKSPSSWVLPAAAH